MRTYPVCTVIAEKFEALVRLDAQNTRMKDFFDLELLLRSDPPDRELRSNAIFATFKRRGSDLPTEVPTGLSDGFAQEKQVMWSALLRKNSLTGDDLSKVVERIRSALEWIWKE